MKRVVAFALMLGVGTLIAPAVSQSTGLAVDALEDVDPVGSAQAHVECHPDLMPDCSCYVEAPPYGIDRFPYHCHRYDAAGSGAGG